MGQIKISELTPKGAPLATTDLLMISQTTPDGFESRSITGAEIVTTAQEGLQPTLVSGTNIKTVNSTSLVGSGNIDLTKTDVGLSNVDNTSDVNKPISSATQTALNAKQNTLVSATNIKTINGNSLLGSGDLAISGGGGGGLNVPIKLPSGAVYSNIPFGSSNSTYGMTANVAQLIPFIPANTFTTSNITINVTTLGAGVSARLLIYSHSITTGLPDIKILESTNIDCSTTGIKTIVTSQTFTAGTTYWLGVYSNGSVTFSGCVVGSLFQIAMDLSFNQYNAISRNVTFGTIPSPFGVTHNKISSNVIRMGLTIA